MCSNFGDQHKLLYKQMLYMVLLITASQKHITCTQDRDKNTSIVRKPSSHKQDSSTCFIQQTNFRPKDTYKLKVKKWKKRYFMKMEVKQSWGSNIHRM